MSLKKIINNTKTFIKNNATPIAKGIGCTALGLLIYFAPAKLEAKELDVNYKLDDINIMDTTRQFETVNTTYTVEFDRKGDVEITVGTSGNLKESTYSESCATIISYSGKTFYAQDEDCDGKFDNITMRDSNTGEIYLFLGEDTDHLKQLENMVKSLAINEPDEVDISEIHDYRADSSNIGIYIEQSYDEAKGTRSAEISLFDNSDSSGDGEKSKTTYKLIDSRGDRNFDSMQVIDKEKGSFAEFKPGDKEFETAIKIIKYFMGE